MPLVFTLAIVAVLKAYNAPDVVWGFAICFNAFQWIAYILSIATVHPLDIFKEEEELDPEKVANNLKKAIEDKTKK